MTFHRHVSIALAALSFAVAAPAAIAQVVSRASVSSQGDEADDWCYESAASADGRFVVFATWATNLVAGDTNGFSDVFVRDRVTGQTTRVSLASDGTQGNDHSRAQDISADGRYVVFESWATNLVPDDTNLQLDVFRHDRQTGNTTRVSVGSNGEQGNGSSSAARISADGRFVT